MQRVSGRWFGFAFFVLAGCIGGTEFSKEWDEAERVGQKESALGADWQVVPIASIPTAGSCTSTCVSQLNSDDGNYLKWLACSNGVNTTTEYGNPTDIRFNVPNAASVVEAKVELDAYGSGTNAQNVIECVDSSNRLLATVAPLFKPGTSAVLHSFAVPKACFDGSNVTIRLRRTGSHCVGADVIRLMTKAANSEPIVDYPIYAIPTAGSCTGSCITPLNTNDGSYLKWLACSPGNNTTTEYGTPTDLQFAVVEPARVKQASFTIDAMASAVDAPMRFECVDKAGLVLGKLFEGSISKTAQTYEWPIPLACMAAGSPVTIRITRTGGYCLGVDYAKVSTIYDGAPPAPAVTPPPVPTGYVSNKHSIEGYADKLSAAPGETIDFKIHSPRPRYSIEFMRLGQQRQSLLTVSNQAGAIQHYPADAVRSGANWATKYTLTVPSNWTSGMYAARLLADDGTEFYVTFIVREASPGSTARLGVLASTNTWHGYNDWGGGNFYSYTLGDGKGQTLSTGVVISQFVSMARPNPAANPNGDFGHLAQAEQHVIRWLERERYPYEMLADTDFHSTPSLLSKYSAIIINTHSEYWTAEMYNALESFLNGGGKLLYLSGNGIYWKVTIKNGQIEVRKDAGTHTHTNEKGGMWRDRGRPEARVLGVAYTSTGAGTSAPYSVKAPGHFVFQNTGVAAGTLIGRSGLNRYGGGASGWETDKIVSGQTPSNIVHLAKGTNASSSGADMIYYDRAAGGSVFSVGSITFGGSLAVDPTLSMMVRNVLTKYGIARQSD